MAKSEGIERRLAIMGEDEDENLRPVADLLHALRDRIYVFIQHPLQWEGTGPTEEEMQTKYDSLADNLSRRLLELSTRRVWHERIKDWERAYQKSGRGSTSERAHIIGDDIYEPAAPARDIVPSLDRNRFLKEVVDEVEGAADEVGVIVR